MLSDHTFICRAEVAGEVEDSICCLIVPVAAQHNMLGMLHKVICPLCYVHVV